MLNECEAPRLRIACRCGRAAKVDLAYAGRSLRCRCGATLRIPARAVVLEPDAPTSSGPDLDLVPLAPPARSPQRRAPPSPEPVARDLAFEGHVEAIGGWIMFGSGWLFVLVAATLAAMVAAIGAGGLRAVVAGVWLPITLLLVVGPAALGAFTWRLGRRLWERADRARFAAAGLCGVSLVAALALLALGKAAPLESAAQVAVDLVFLAVLLSARGARVCSLAYARSTRHTPGSSRPWASPLFVLPALPLALALVQYAQHARPA